jgi:hypothetical protein
MALTQLLLQPKEVAQRRQQTEMVVVLVVLVLVLVVVWRLLRQCRCCILRRDRHCTRGRQQRQQ